MPIDKRTESNGSSKDSKEDSQPHKKKYHKCPLCKGSGTNPAGKDCPACGGTGEVES